MSETKVQPSKYDAPIAVVLGGLIALAFAVWSYRVRDSAPFDSGMAYIAAFYMATRTIRLGWKVLRAAPSSPTEPTA